MDWKAWKNWGAGHCKKAIVLASLHPEYLRIGERLLPRLKFGSELTARLPLDVPFNPNSTDGDSDRSDVRKEDNQGDNELRQWKHWITEVPKSRWRSEMGLTQRKQRKVWGFYRQHLEEENGAVPVRIRYSHETPLRRVVSESRRPDDAPQDIDIEQYIVNAYMLREACVLAINFSVTDLSAVDKIPHMWLPLIRHHCPFLPIVLVACDIEKRTEKVHAINRTLKDDARDENTQCLTKDQGEKMAKEIGAKYYIECSRTTGENVVMAYKAMTAALLIKEEIQDETKAVRDEGGEDHHIKIRLSENDWERGAVFPDLARVGKEDIFPQVTNYGYIRFSKDSGFRGTTPF